MIGWKTIENFLSQWYHVERWRKFCAETLKKVLSNEKKWLQGRSSGTSSTRFFFMFILLISNHMVFLVQFGINLHLWVFQKAEITLAEAAWAISVFWKTHSCKLIPNWTRNRMITYTYLYSGGECWTPNQVAWVRAWGHYVAFLGKRLDSQYWKRGWPVMD